MGGTHLGNPFNFNLHPLSCPQILTSSMHQHQLMLTNSAVMAPLGYTCDVCGQSVHGTFYLCTLGHLCDWGAHPSCIKVVTNNPAPPPPPAPPPKSEAPETQNLTSSMHEHELMLVNTATMPFGFNCDVCRLFIQGNFYYCTKSPICDWGAHPLCLKGVPSYPPSKPDPPKPEPSDPQFLTSSVHEHQLMLLNATPTTSRSCDVCQHNIIQGTNFYHCTKTYCDFDAHSLCTRAKSIHDNPPQPSGTQSRFVHGPQPHVSMGVPYNYAPSLAPHVFGVQTPNYPSPTYYRPDVIGGAYGGPLGQVPNTNMNTMGSFQGVGQTGNRTGQENPGLQFARDVAVETLASVVATGLTNLLS